MKRLPALGMIVGLFAVGPPGVAADGDAKAAKEALKELQEFVGEYKGAGGPDKAGHPTPKETWTETINWGWKFKGDDAWITLDVKDGRYLKSGEVRYLPDKKK